MIIVRELIDLYNYSDFNDTFVNDGKYKPIYDNIKVLNFETGYEYSLWIYVDSEDKREADNKNCNNPFD